jgi:predicted PurR-regulated permease PerM
MCRSVILATVASGFVQSVVFGLACAVAGAPSAALIALIVFLASFIPLIGAAPVTFGVAFHELLVGHQGGGIALLVFAVAVGLVDNLIRPIVLRGAGNLHPLLAFVGAFGGLQVLGFAGVFLGPILAGLCVVTVDNLTRSNKVA